MGPLKNTKHEAFVRGIVAGKSGRQAYTDAGYTCTPDAADAAASRLLTDVKVKGRLDELQTKVADKVVLSKAWVIEETIDLQQKAKAALAFGPSAKCLELLAREVNTFIPKAEIGLPGDFDDKSDDELRRRALAIARGAAGTSGDTGRARKTRGQETLQ